MRAGGSSRGVRVTRQSGARRPRHLTSLPRVRDCDTVVQPNSSLVPRGVTLLELLIVLTLMGIAAAVVAPSFATRSAAPVASRVALVTSARRMAVRRAERLSLQLARDGAWTLRTLANGAVLDSGRVADSLPNAELLLDALGGCVPARGEAAGAPFDPLTCSYASHVTSP